MGRIKGLLMLKINYPLVLALLIGNIFFSYELSSDQKIQNKIAINCTGKHPQRNIQHTVLLWIDRLQNTLEESRYCGSKEPVNLVLGSSQDEQLVWYSYSPFIINGFGEKVLNLKELKFEYMQTWGKDSQNRLVRGKRSWSADCRIIDWDESQIAAKNLRC